MYLGRIVFFALHTLIWEHLYMFQPKHNRLVQSANQYTHSKCEFSYSQIKQIYDNLTISLFGQYKRTSILYYTILANIVVQYP